MTSQVPIKGGGGRYHAAAKSMIRTVKDKYMDRYEPFVWQLADGDAREFKYLWTEADITDVAKSHAMKVHGASYQPEKR